MKKIIFILILPFLIFTSACNENESLNLISGGTGGSMARFAITDDHLYIVSPTKLMPYDISDPWSPAKQNDIYLGTDIETVFPYLNYLFIGAETGMHIYDISDPGTPNHVSTYQHVRSCDPVVVQGDFAYVTLRTNNICEGSVNVLEVIDISNIAQPQLVNSINLASPHGLGIDGQDLFVCNGDFGLIALDATDPVNPEVKREYPSPRAYDVILKNGLMILTGKDGIYQYNYSDPDTLINLSKINIMSDEL